jgi:hypothetical protein
VDPRLGRTPTVESELAHSACQSRSTLGSETCPGQRATSATRPTLSVSFVVEDLETALTAAGRLGGTQLGEVTCYPNGRRVYCRDPSGTGIELTEYFERAGRCSGRRATDHPSESRLRDGSSASMTVRSAARKRATNCADGFRERFTWTVAWARLTGGSASSAGRGSSHRRLNQGPSPRGATPLRLSDRVAPVLRTLGHREGVFARLIRRRWES